MIYGKIEAMNSKIEFYLAPQVAQINGYNFEQ